MSLIEMNPLPDWLELLALRCFFILYILLLVTLPITSRQKTEKHTPGEPK